MSKNATTQEQQEETTVTPSAVSPYQATVIKSTTLHAKLAGQDKPTSGAQAARKGPPSRKPRYVNIVLPAEIWPRLDLMKDYAQDEGLTLSSRQRIGRDGVISGVIAWFLDQAYADQMSILAEGIEKIKAFPSFQTAGAITRPGREKKGLADEGDK